MGGGTGGSRHLTLTQSGKHSPHESGRTRGCNVSTLEDLLVTGLNDKQVQRSVWVSTSKQLEARQNSSYRAAA